MGVEKMECKHCGTEIQDGSKFCPHCGGKQGKDVCLNCGEELIEGAKFCSECGTPVGATKRVVVKKQRQFKINFEFIKRYIYGSLIALTSILLVIALFLPIGKVNLLEAVQSSSSDPSAYTYADEIDGLDKLYINYSMIDIFKAIPYLSEDMTIFEYQTSLTRELSDVSDIISNVNNATLSNADIRDINKALDQFNPLSALAVTAVRENAPLDIYLMFMILATYMLLAIGTVLLLVFSVLYLITGSNFKGQQITLRALLWLVPIMLSIVAIFNSLQGAHLGSSLLLTMIPLYMSVVLYYVFQFFNGERSFDWKKLVKQTSIFAVFLISMLIITHSGVVYVYTDNSSAFSIRDQQNMISIAQTFGTIVNINSNLPDASVFTNVISVLINSGTSSEIANFTNLFNSNYFFATMDLYTADRLASNISAVLSIVAVLTVLAFGVTTGVIIDGILFGKEKKKTYLVLSILIAALAIIYYGLMTYGASALLGVISHYFGDATVRAQYLLVFGAILLTASAIFNLIFKFEKEEVIEVVENIEA